MASRNPRIDFYGPKTLEGMDQAFVAIWAIVRGPVRNHENDSELRIAVGRKLLNLVADGVTDPIQLRQLTVESLFLPGGRRSHARGEGPLSRRSGRSGLPPQSC